MCDETLIHHQLLQLLAAIDTGLCNECHGATAVHIDFITTTSSPDLHQRRNYQSNKYGSRDARPVIWDCVFVG
jgi:hypothetical protein